MRDDSDGWCRCGARGIERDLLMDKRDLEERIGRRDGAAMPGRRTADRITNGIMDNGAPADRVQAAQAIHPERGEILGEGAEQDKGVTAASGGLPECQVVGNCCTGHAPRSHRFDGSRHGARGKKAGQAFVSNIRVRGEIRCAQKGNIDFFLAESAGLGVRVIGEASETAWREIKETQEAWTLSVEWGEGDLGGRRKRLDRGGLGVFAATPFRIDEEE